MVDQVDEDIVLLQRILDIEVSSWPSAQGDALYPLWLVLMGAAVEGLLKPSQLATGYCSLQEQTAIIFP